MYKCEDKTMCTTALLLRELQVLVSKLTPKSSLLQRRDISTLSKKALWDDTANRLKATGLHKHNLQVEKHQYDMSHIKAKPARSKADVWRTFCVQSTDNKRPLALNISCLLWISIISSFYFAPWNSHKCKLQLALSCRDSYINLFLGQFPCGESLENTVLLDAIILHWHKLLVAPALR